MGEPLKVVVASVSLISILKSIRLGLSCSSLSVTTLVLVSVEEHVIVVGSDHGKELLEEMRVITIRVAAVHWVVHCACFPGN